MNTKVNVFGLLHAVCALFLAGCSSLSGWETQKAMPGFVNGTRILTEVILIASRDQVLANQGLMAGWRTKMLAAGYSDSDIVDGSEVTLWSYCFGWNSGVPICAHHGHYVAHIPAELRGHLQSDPDDRWETSGDLVEVELTSTPSGDIVGTVIALYRKGDDWSPCKKTTFAQLSQASSLGNALSPVGPPRAMWIECDANNSAGWVRRPVLGSPASGGPPISEWVKSPR